jgi:hypothetical protein
MKSKYALLLSAVALMTGTATTISIGSGFAAAQSQTSTAPTTKWALARTAWGDPDLQGKWLVADAGAPLERPKEFGNREFVTERELAERIANRSKQAPADDRDAAIVREKQPAHEKGIRGEEYNRFWVDTAPKKIAPWNRTSLVIDPPDGRIPPLTPDAIRRVEEREAARRGRGEADGWEDRNLSERCLLTTFVRFEESGAAALSVKQIVQAPGYVAIVVSTLNSNEPIVIPLDSRPRPGGEVRTWLGIPRGRWESNSLVVETTNINGRQDGGAIMPSRLPFQMPGAAGAGGFLGPGDTLRTVERFTRVGPDVIEYRYTIDDPKTYVRPYTVLRPLTKEPDDLLMPENGCHEGNYGIVGQLSAGRADEAYALTASQSEASARQPRLQELKQRTDEWMKSREKR